MKLVFDNYWQLQDQLFRLKIAQKDDADKSPIIELKSKLSQGFKAAYPKGFTAKEYKAHQAGAKIISFEFSLSASQQDLVEKARQLPVEPKIADKE